jgi:chromosome segregation ATPase
LISRLGRKRRDRRAQTQPDHPFAIEHCEYLTDGAFALLRVSGTGSVAPVALVTQGDGPEAFDPLPQPDAGAKDGAWQIAFALPTDVIEPGARVWLHDGGLYLADLLIPSPGEPEAPTATSESVDDADEIDDARAQKLVEAWAEAARLREKLSDREEELAQTLKDLLEARSALETGGPVPVRDDSGVEALRTEAETRRTEAEALRTEVESLRADVARLEAELSAARKETAASEAERTKLEESNKSRRAGIARRGEDRAMRKQIADLEKQVAERDKRVEALEKEAESFAARREDAVADSLREQVEALGEDARQRAATNDDLRALLESEREIAAAARREVDDLRQQLAAVRAEQIDAAQPAAPRPRPVPATAENGEPWTALDDELLARIEKAKLATRV